MRAKRRKWGARRALSVWLACLMLISSVSLPVQAAEPQTAFGERLEDTPENPEVSEPGTDGESESPDQEAGAQESGETDTTEQPSDAAGSDGENQKPGEEEAGRPENPDQEEEQPADPDSPDETQQPDTPDEEKGDETEGEDSDKETDDADLDNEELPAVEDGQLKDKKSKAVASGDGETDEAVKLQVAYHTQEEIKSFLKESGATISAPVTFAEDPATSAPYAAGKLSEQTQQSAIAMLNQIRYIAGLSYDVALDEEYAAASQAAALVNYANRALSHTPAQPEGMDDTLYSAGYNGAKKSNIAYSAAGPIGVGVPMTLNETLVQSWMEDGDSSNISRVGHRRWILNPSMGKTGFGAVVGDDESKNMSVMYSAVYAHDSSGSGSNLFGVAWPAQNMPVNYFSTEHPWSVSLGGEVTASEIQVKLTRAGDGKTWDFSSTSADGYFNVDNGNYGQTGCIIFRPSDVASYAAGDSFHVEITKNGASYVDYTVDFFDVSTGEENPDTPEDPDTKKILTVSGFSLTDKIYDGLAFSYAGTSAVLKDLSGNEVSDVGVAVSYAGTLADGSAYEKTETAPTQAGEYTLTFSLKGEGVDQYVLQNASHSFKIAQRELVITANSVNVNIGGKLPALSELTYKVEGLLEGETLLVEPSFKYDPDTVTTDTAGTYEIIPYGAEAGNNYSVIYVNGVLKVKEEDIRYSGTVNQISWKIDSNGKLTVEGTGDYTGEATSPPWSRHYFWIRSAEVRVTSMTKAANMFSGCSELKSVDLSGFDTGSIIDMSGMFSGCGSLKGVDLSSFNTSNVTDMSNMFFNCSSLQNLDLSGFDTGNVTGMGSMFRGCSNLQSLDLSSFGTGNVTSMYDLFDGCSSLQSLDLSGFDTGNATSMTSMFRGCSDLQSIDLSSFDTSNVEQMESMFENCSNLGSLDLSGFDMRKVWASSWNGMQYLFLGGCDKLVSIRTPQKPSAAVSRIVLPVTNDAGQWYDERGVAYNTLPRATGTGNTSITLIRKKLNSGEMNDILWEVDENGRLTISGKGNYIDVRQTVEALPGEPADMAPWTNRKDVISAVVNVSEIRSTDRMFYGCSNLKNIDLSGLDTSEVSGMSDMFSGCSSLQSVDLSSFNTSNVTNMSGMFSGCSSLQSLSLSGLDTGNVTGMDSMFSGCSSLQNLNLSGLDTGNVTGMDSMFSGCSNLQNLNLSSFDTGNVTGMDSMFFGCSNLQNLNLSWLDTGNVTRMGSMFRDCSSLQNLNLSSFNTGNVTRMDWMFSGCSSLQNLNLSSFDTGNVTDMAVMFQNCSGLNSLDLSNFTTGNVIYMTNMFEGCSGLRNLNLSGFNTAKVSEMYGCFSGCGSLQSLDLSGFDMSGVSYGFSIDDCANLSYIRTPKNCNLMVILPKSGDKWYDRDGKEYTELPCGLAESIELYKGRFPDDGQMGQYACVSGITVTSKTYDGQAFAYTGTAAVTDASGDVIPDIELTALYTGTLTDGSSYSDTAEAPSQAGEYTITFSLAGANADNYLLQGAVYRFKIYQRTVTITAPDREVEVGGQLPDLSLLEDYTVDGLLTGGQLLKTPSFRYGKNAISTDRPGSYAIIPYGADAGMNYRIKYVKAALTVGTMNSYDLSEAEIEFPDIVYDGRLHVVNPIVRYRSWTLREGIDYSMKVSESTGAGLISYGSYTCVSSVGKYTICITGLGFYCGEREKTFRVTKKAVDPDPNPEFGEVRPEDVPAGGKIPEGLWLAGVSEYGYEYTGKAIKPAVRVYDHKTLLREKTDYTISYANNVNANATLVDSTNGSSTPSVPTIIVKGKGNYNGTVKKYFDILPIDMSDWEVAGVEADDMTVAYNGRPQKPQPVLMRNGVKLNNANYSIAYYRYNEEKGEDELLDSVKEPGIYSVEFRGKGNFAGSFRCALTVTDSLKVVGKLKVSKIPDQAYAGGNEITPAVTVKDGMTTLEQGVHYTLEYRSNYGVGTAYAIITGIPETGYSGTKRIAFKITGTPIKKATVTFGTEFLPYIYNGTEIEAELWLTIKKKSNGTETTEYLEKDRDYTLTWQKNENAGTASVIITGIGGYTGTVKKSFKINKYDIAANTAGQFNVVLEDSLISYAKGGVKAKPIVTFEAGDGSELTLTEGKDYTLSYRRHTKLTGEGTDQLAEITVKGKGNFSGTYQNKLYYEIVRQDIGNLTLTAQDKVYKNKKNIYATKVTVTDVNGKALKAGTDYDSAITYTYANPTEVQDASANGTVVNRAAGDTVENNDIIPAGTVLKAKVTAKESGSYFGSLEGEYRITQESIASATVSVPQQTYTGQPVTLDKSDITVKVKGQPVAADQWEIVPDSYKNNVKKGTASVTIQGVDNYGGTKTIKFTIKAKGFLW